MPVATITSREIVREAVLVGVGYFTNEALLEAEFQTLEGAHRDTMNLRRLLTKKYGYKNEDITILVDSDDRPRESWPTRENIISAMEKLIADKQAGDHIVFSFSGHGCQVEALIEGEEEDGMDEILLPVNATVDSQSKDYFVDFIRDNLIFDCCHSGTASDLPNVIVQSPIITPDSPYFSFSSPRAPGSFVRMDTLHDGHVDDAAAPCMRPILRTGPSWYLDREVTSWSACLDEQTTFGKRSGGIFMKAFTKTLDAKPNPTHRDLLRELRKNILHVTEEENEKLQTRWQTGLLPRGSPQPEEFVAPRPQLGSLRPDSILLDTFTL
uniref:Metacaspase-1 (EC) n=1 Tax=Ganoderma boninense TaxID=34458 RepID=A0A5K1JWX7_9APHY|nr:Metacaspase-1 (EC [Ganoderma boninense]